MLMNELPSKILTISIAAYNVENYIRRTMDSLIDERVIDDLEIFVVDDGGTDRTLEIAKGYAERYPHSVFPIHKENGGYGSTVNYSIAHATGKYFKLLDGDDWFDKEGLYQLVSMLKETNADLVITPFCKVNETNTVENIRYDVRWGEEIEFDELLKERLPLFHMHTMTYRTKVIRDSELELPEKCLYTDVIYATVPISLCKTISFLESIVYMYSIGREGQSVERSSRVKHKSDYKKISLIDCGHYERLKSLNAENLQYIRLRAASGCTGAIISILASPVNSDSLRELKEFDRKIREISEDVFYEEEQLGKVGKLMKLLRRTGYLPYWFLKLVPGGFPYRA